MVFGCMLLQPAAGQTALVSQSALSSQKQIRPLSLPHLYWHFLAYQNHLDTKAAATTAAGKDGSALRNLLQKKLGFSNADFALIRTSSVRLTAEVQSLDAQAVAIRAVGPSPSSLDQLHALTVQRETEINAEISYLKQNLPPDKIIALEAFLKEFFSPSNAVPPEPSVVGPLAPAGVQR
jgi:hypothetical protein